MKRKFDRDALLARRRDAEKRDHQRDVECEEGRVRYLLTKFKLHKKQNVLLEVAEQRTGSRVLTLDLFNEMVPNFPILMGWAPKDKVDKLHADNRATWQATFRRFQDVPYVLAYDEFYEQMEGEANGRAVGLLFTRKGVNHGFIIHNGKGLGEYWYKGTKQIYYGGSRDKPEYLIVEMFDPLITAMYNEGHGFKPDLAF